MGKATWMGWRKAGDEIPVATGPEVKRDGQVVLTLYWRVVGGVIQHSSFRSLPRMSLC